MDKEKIAEHFGAEFLEKVTTDLDKYAAHWGLSDFTHIDYYSVNCIFTCFSAAYGQCVLKIGKHLGGAKSEYNMLKEFDGSGLCKVYEAEIKNGVLLIKQKCPAHN